MAVTETNTSEYPYKAAEIDPEFPYGKVRYDQLLASFPATSALGTAYDLCQMNGGGRYHLRMGQPGSYKYGPAYQNLIEIVPDIASMNIYANSTNTYFKYDINGINISED